MLDALGVRLVEGRAFTRDDVLRNTEQLRALNAIERVRNGSGIAASTVTVPAIITRAYAKLMFPEGQPLGKTFEDEDGDRWRVVGSRALLQPVRLEDWRVRDVLPSAPRAATKAGRRTWCA